MKTSDLLKDSAVENQKELMDWLKKAIILKSGTVSSFCKETGIYSPSQWAGIFAGDKRPGLAEVLAAIDYVGGFVKVGLPDGFIRNIVGKSIDDVVPKKRVPTTIDYARELVVPEKELQKQKDVEARAAEKSEKESRKLWHPSRHKLILPPEETDIETVHDYLMSMAARMHAVTGFSCRGIFDFVADTSDSWSYWIGGHGYPHLRIPADLSQCGELAGEHWNKKEMHSIFGIKPEWVRYANPNEIHYYYNAIFLPQFKKLKDLLETGFEPDDKPHVFGGKTALYWKNSIAVPWVKQSLKTPGVDMRLVGAPFRHLDYLDWDYENDCAIVIPDPRILKWEEVFTRDNRDGVYDDKVIHEVE